MTISRSIETRLMEGLRRDFLANADVLDYFTGGVHCGPLTDNDTVIRPPQINIALAPGDIYEFGSGGVTKDRIPIAIKAYFPVAGQDKGYRTGISAINVHDWAKHLQLIVLNGSVDPWTEETNGNGYVLDPDRVWALPLEPSPDPTRWLNEYCFGVTRQIAVFTDKMTALLVPFLIDYQVRVTTLTGERV